MNLPCRRDEIVWVTWDDACSDSSRGDLDRAGEIKLARYVSLGWITHRNDQRIILAHGVVETGEIDYLAIPCSAIVEITHVAKARKQAKAKATGTVAQPGGGE